ncbi:MAG: nucleotidyltransferase domain-containing protein [Candidatus Helarchaeota archaeon]
MSFEAELNKIIEAVKKFNLKIKFYGSIGIKLLSSSHMRHTFDIDFLALSEESNNLKALLESLGYRMSGRKKRTDLVFFKKDPLKIKIDVELDKFRVFDTDIELNLINYIKLDGLILPPHLLFITKLYAPLTEDNIYDLGHLLATNSFTSHDFLNTIQTNSLDSQILFEKISLLSQLIFKNKILESSIKMKAKKFLKIFKRELGI